jgi:hypothetical protein
MDDRRPRKDRLIQTRVDENLESALKDEAERRRLPVSQLIRNILEDTMHLVGGVVDGVDAIVQDSMTFGRRLTKPGTRTPQSAAAEPRPEARAQAQAPEPEADMSDVYAWSEVVLHQAVMCSSCRAALAAGQTGFLGLRDDPSRGRAWRCPPCVARLGR